MPEEKEKKGYSVVDKRSAVDEPADVPQAQPQATPQAEPSAPAPEAAEGEPEERYSEEKGRIMNVQEIIALFLNILRDQAVYNLGMPLHPGMEGRKNPERVEQIIALTKRVMEKFGKKVFPETLQARDEQIELPEIIASYLAMLQEYVLIYSGLLANPATGLVSRQTDQARLGIDMFALLINEFESVIPAGERARMRAALSDLQLNFARQSGL